MNDLSELEEIIGVHFKDKGLLKNALIHRSYLNEKKGSRLTSNEKLEFLGDSVLSLVTSNYLFNSFPDLREGDYTDIKAYIVSTESLADAASDLDLWRFIHLSKGERVNTSVANKSILADSFEAIIGAIFLDQGLPHATIFIKNFLFKDNIRKIVESSSYHSAKNKLQEYWQERVKQLPRYRVLEEQGPQHAKQYRVAVYLNNKIFGLGTGYSKKEAEEAAARAALKSLRI